MTFLYKGKKVDENALTPCAKCDCLILSDSSDPNNDKCIRIKKTNGTNVIRNYSSTDVDDKKKVPLKPKISFTTSPITSYTKGQDDSTDKSTSTTEKSSRIETAKSDSRKHICFRFCRKKKNDLKKTDSKIKDGGNQTSKAALSNNITQYSCEHVDQFVKNCLDQAASKGASQGGCNTNTIIFQRDPASGDGITHLENWLKMEAKANSRNLEDILSELHKQRREIHELKDMLDTVVRALREELFATVLGSIGKSKHDLFKHSSRTKTNKGDKKLERKTTNLSLKKSKTTNSTEEQYHEGESLDSSSKDLQGKKRGGEKKKKAFLWCK